MGSALSITATAIKDLVWGRRTDDAVSGYELVAILFSIGDQSFIAGQCEKRALNVLKKYRSMPSYQKRNLPSRMQASDIHFRYLDVAKLAVDDFGWSRWKGEETRLHVIFDPTNQQSELKVPLTPQDKEFRIGSARFGYHLITKLVLPFLTGDTFDLESRVSNVHTVWNASRIVGLRASQVGCSIDPELGHKNPLVQYAFTNSGQWFTANYHSLEGVQHGIVLDPEQEAASNTVQPGKAYMYLFTGDANVFPLA